MRFGSVCSGIEAASVAWNPIGWEAAWFSEIEPFPSAVLAHHYSEVPNLGDMTSLPEQIRAGLVEAPDLLCGGTPCQAFSVAGQRKSLDDERGNLSLTFCEIADAIDEQRDEPAIIFWENVPGVLSTKDNAFGCFLGELAGEECALEPAGGKWSYAGCVYGPKRTVAWRTLDAQYFGVAQRRRRVFVVASARTDIDPAAILFEFDGLRRDTAPSREAGKVAPTIPSRSTAGGGLGTDFDCDGGVIPAKLDVDICGTLTAGFGKVGAPEVDAYTCIPAYPINTMIALRHEALGERTGFGIGEPGDPSFTITKGHSHAVAHAVKKDLPIDPYLGGEVTISIDASYGKGCGGTSAAERPVVVEGMAVRRLTPVECERLQGFPDNYTMIPWRKKDATECPDGPRYKALGNSWAVPNVRWIGERIQLAVEVSA